MGLSGKASCVHLPHFSWHTGSREDISLIRVNESLSCTCCSEALLSPIHVTAAAKERTPRAPWCRPRVLYVYRLLQCVLCRVNPDSAAPASTKPLHRRKQIMLASTQHLLGGESLMKSRKCTILTGCNECNGDVDEPSKPGNRH